MIDPEVFLQAVTHWARNKPGLLALALVGSHARGQARPESDIDLVLLLTEPQTYLLDTAWVGAFGQAERVVNEDWGRVTSLRVWYADGAEVEFGLAPVDWGADPGEAGDAQVIRDGIRVLYEVGDILSKRIYLIG